MSFYFPDVFVGFNISENEVAYFRDTHAGLCRVDLNRISEFLMIQLASIYKHRTYNVFSITDVIQELEGVGRGCKQRVQQFKHLPLKGFWKTHFFDARFIPRNLINHWGLEFENSQKFDNLYNDIVKQEKDSPSSDGGYGRLAYAITIGGYEERARKNKLTGEWIIFAKHKGQNYYLCISRHTSGEKDRLTYDFLRNLCENEYPFLDIPKPF